MGFAAESFERLGIVGDIIGQEFQCDEPVQACVLSFVNHAHTTSTEFLGDAVVGNRAACDV